MSAVFELSDLNGSNGFVINGVNPGGFSGGTVSNAGDVNNDGIDDFIIGAPGNDANAANSGTTYIVFGSTQLNAAVDLSSLDGSNGLAINGIALDDGSGTNLSSAGDVNGDGIDDILIGGDFLNLRTPDRPGEAYVVFGRSNGFPAALELSALNGANGFKLHGIDPRDYTGRVSTAGDLNGDGLDDLLIGGIGGDPNGPYSGETYVVFGSTNSFPSTFELSDLNGSNGFQINGIHTDDQAGSVGGGGDINGDGFDDILIGAHKAPDSYYGPRTGEVYIVFGRLLQHRTSALVPWVSTTRARSPLASNVTVGVR